MLLALLVLFVILAIAGLPAWPYAATWGLGYWPSGILALIVIVLLISALANGGFARTRDPLV